MAAQLQVGPQALNQGGIANARSDDYGNQTVIENGPKFLEWNRRGYVYTAYSNTALVMPVATTPTNSPTLWNPLGSGKLVVVMHIGLGAAATATLPASGIGVLMSYNMGTPPAVTGAAFATFTPLVTKYNNLTGVTGLLAGSCQFAVVETWTAVVVTPMWFFSQFTLTAVAGGIAQTSVDPEGLVVLQPGTACSVVATIATAATYWPTITYAELPMPQPTLP